MSASNNINENLLLGIHILYIGTYNYNIKYICLRNPQINGTFS